MSVGLFGAFYLRSGVEVPAPLSDKVWVIEPGSALRELTRQSFVQEATLRYIEQDEQAEQPEQGEKEPGSDGT